MIKVLRHGNKIRVKNPATQELSTLVDVIFIERGRGGANGSLSASSEALSEVFGKNMGLDQVRTHTQAVPEAEVAGLPIGKELPLFINRTLYSEAVMRQQEGLQARRIGGRPTFFATELSKVALPDVDKRDPNEVIARYKPDLLSNTVIGGTEVEILEMVAAPVATTEEVVHEPLA